MASRRPGPRRMVPCDAAPHAPTGVSVFRRFHAVACVTNPSSPFRSPITDDDLMMLPHVAANERRRALRALRERNEKI